MSYFTALKLSFKNLLTKKLRTILTAVAGSVGIIGVALILAASNGMTIYVNDLQRNMLAGMPIEIARISTMFNEREFDTPPGMVRPSQPFFTPHFNNFSQAFIDEVITPIQEMGNHVSFNYDTQLNILHQFQPTSGGATQYTMLGSWMDYARSEDGWQWHGVNPFELPHEVYVQNMLTTLAEADQVTRDARAAEGAIPLTLILNQNSIVNRNIIHLLFGQSTQDVSFNDILNQEFRLVPNDVAIHFNQGIEEYRWTRQGADVGNGPVDLWGHTDSRPMYIDRIMRQQAGAFSFTLAPGLGFPNGLPRDIVRDNNQNEMTVNFAEEMREYIDDVFEDLTALDWIAIGLGNQAAIDDFVSRVNTINHTFRHVHREGVGFLADIDLDELDLDGNAEFLLAMLQLHARSSALGLDLAAVEAFEPIASMIPSMMSGISIYPTSFENSEAIKRMISDWNDANPYNQIHFLDLMSMLVDILNEMIMAVSIVMIVVSSISLVVSTLMIGIITYVSVLERTKEIGILRAIGARKKDIRRVFGAETLIIGFTAGVIGIIMTLILILPINWALYNFDVVDVTNLARLPIWGAFGLIALSCALTMMSGFFPSRVAAKRDPVVALRTD